MALPLLYPKDTYLFTWRREKVCVIYAPNLIEFIRRRDSLADTHQHIDTVRENQIKFNKLT